MPDTPAAKSVFHQDGVLVDSQTIVLANAFHGDPDAPNSQLAVLNAGTWMQFEIKTDSIVTLAATRDDLYAVGRNGLFLRMALPLPLDRAGVLACTTMAVIREAHKFGELTRCRAVGDAAYVVGQCGQVYRLSPSGFDEFSFGLRSDDGPDLEDVGGFSASALYACGTGGAVLRFDGARWQHLDSPTNANLSGIFVESERSAYFCGDAGILIHLIDDQWFSFVSDVERNYWDICCFRGAIVLAHGSGLDSFDGSSFRPLDPAPAADNTFYRVCAHGDLLLSTGPDDLFIVEPNSVRPIAVPGRA